MTCTNPRHYITKFLLVNLFWLPSAVSLSEHGPNSVFQRCRALALGLFEVTN